MHRMIAVSLAMLLGTLPAAAQDRQNDKVADRGEYGTNGQRDDVQLRRIPTGTDIPVTLTEDVPINRDHFGDTFDARVTRDVVSKGKVVIPAGAPAKVKLVESSEKANAATVRLSDVEVNGAMARR